MSAEFFDGDARHVHERRAKSAGRRSPHRAWALASSRWLNGRTRTATTTFWLSISALPLFAPLLVLAMAAAGDGRAPMVRLRWRPRSSSSPVPLTGEASGEDDAARARARAAARAAAAPAPDGDDTSRVRRAPLGGVGSRRAVQQGAAVVFRGRELVGWVVGDRSALLFLAHRSTPRKPTCHAVTIRAQPPATQAPRNPVVKSRRAQMQKCSTAAPSTNLQPRGCSSAFLPAMYRSSPRASPFAVAKSELGDGPHACCRKARPAAKREGQLLQHSCTPCWAAFLSPSPGAPCATRGWLHRRWREELRMLAVACPPTEHAACASAAPTIAVVQHPSASTRPHPRTFLLPALLCLPQADSRCEAWRLART